MASCFVSAIATDAHWGSFRHSCDKLHSLPPNTGGQKFALIAIEEPFPDGGVVPVTALETPKEPQARSQSRKPQVKVSVPCPS